MVLKYGQELVNFLFECYWVTYFVVRKRIINIVCKVVLKFVSRSVEGSFFSYRTICFVINLRFIGRSSWFI